MTDDEKRNIVNQYRAVLNLTKEQEQFANKLGSFFEVQFQTAFNNRKAFGEGARSTPELRPEELARRVTDVISMSFSAATLFSWLEKSQLTPGWTLDDALAVWYSVGNVALVVAVWTTFDDATKAPRIIYDCRLILKGHWCTSDEVFRKLLSTINETEASAFESFVGCANGKDLLTFFGRYVSRLLGAPVPFSERSLFQDEMMGIKYLSDLALEAGLCQLFVDTCTTTKRLLEACIVD